ncbi:MAG: hypothetical protein ACLFV7_11255 [Phycisphaerae bacterium]
MKRSTGAVIACALVVGLLGGCQKTARIAWDEPRCVTQKRTPLYVGELCCPKREGHLWGSKASGEGIGKHTFTVFAIPVGDIHASSDTPVAGSFDRAVREALTAAGYDIRPESQAPQGAPVLRGDLKECFFWSYSWFYPLFVQGGKTRVALRMEQPGQGCIWKREFKGDGPGVGFIGSFGFDGMVRRAMNSMLADIAAECSREEFRQKVSATAVASH